MITRDDAIREVVKAVSDLSEGLREHSRKNAAGFSGLRDDMGELGDRIDGVLAAVRRLELVERAPAANGSASPNGAADSAEGFEDATPDKEPSLVFFIPGVVQFSARKGLLRWAGKYLPWLGFALLGVDRGAELMQYIRGH